MMLHESPGQIITHFLLFQVMTSFIFLVIGFALSFTLIFPTSEFFKSPWDSFVRTVVMMIGEFEYTGTYAEASDVRLD